MPIYFKLSENQNYTLEKISQFNDECFPIRKPHRFYDIYRFVQNPFASLEKNFLYGVEKDGKYIAQMLTMPVPLTKNEEIIPSFWGQDYFVSEENRGEGIGKELANYYLNNPYYIAVGFSEKSAIIHQKMGAMKIGYLDFYQKWASPIHKVKFYFQRVFKIKPKTITSFRFPDQVGEFKRIQTPAELILPKLNWNDDVIESIRNRKYFEWRFFYKLKPYEVYQSQNAALDNPPYFVVKPHFYRGVNWLQVVDYRFDNSKIDQFNSIMKQVSFLRKNLSLYGILISSSQKISNEILHENKFERFKHEVVLTTFPFQHSENVVDHNHLNISFADSDMDMHNYLGRFYFGEDFV